MNKCASQKCYLRLAEKVAIAGFEGVGLSNKQTKLSSSVSVDIEINLL